MPDTKDVHAKRCEEHQAIAEQYVIEQAMADEACRNLAEAYAEAKQSIINCGALNVDDDGNIMPGWYKGEHTYQSQEVARLSNIGVAVKGGVVGLAGSIGAPVAAWTLVGTFGTASTGAAISGLSGAAATSATAAWFGGGAVAAGGLGVAAAPFVLTGIGAVAGLGILGVASLIAIGRNRRNSKEIEIANGVMQEAERRMKVNAVRLQDRGNRAKEKCLKLVKATGVLEVIQTDASVDTVHVALVEAEELFPELRENLPFERIYIGKPSPVKVVKSIKTTSNSISMDWDDPDGGETEITYYRIMFRDGFWGEGKALRVVDSPSFVHTGLEPGKAYYYKVIPVNNIGEGEDSEEFKAETRRI